MQIQMRVTQARLWLESELSGLFSKRLWLVLGDGSSHCLNCDLLDLYRAGISIAFVIRSFDLFTRLMDFCDYLDCMWQVAGDESARLLS